MPEAPPLQVYPELWRQSRDQYPHDWQWPDQFRALCALARAWRRNNRAAYCRLLDSERLALAALAEADVEDFIATLKSDYPHEPNPMLRIDPFDPSVEEDSPPSLMNGKRYHA